MPPKSKDTVGVAVTVGQTGTPPEEYLMVTMFAPEKSRTYTPAEPSTALI